MKLVFLDRDGVINEFPGNGKYVTKVKDFHFIPGSLEAIRLLTQAGYTIFVVSNQAGVGKGVFTLQKLNHITRNMLAAVGEHGGKIKEVFYSTQPSNAGCDFRKPRIGSIKKAMRSINKTMRSAHHAFFVGDTQIDIETGINAGCRTIFVLSGREDLRYLRRKWKVRPDYIAKDLLEAVQIMLANEEERRTAQRYLKGNLRLNRSSLTTGVHGSDRSSRVKTQNTQLRSHPAKNKVS